MDAIETLMTEHRQIERAIDALVGFVDALCQKGSTDDKAELAKFVTFISEFADAGHHGKEEDILFAAMVEAGFPRSGGPIAVMLMEHDAGRQQVGVLRQLCEQAPNWTAPDREAMHEAAHGYANLLRAHIHKEDAILYPMAEQRLPPAMMERVEAACEEFERQRAASGEGERLRRLGEDLVARYAPA